MWSKCSAAAVSLVIVLTLPVCTTLRGKTRDKDNSAGKEIPAFSVESLSFADNPSALADFAEDMACRCSSVKNKEMAYSIAVRAHELASNDKEIALVLAEAAFLLADCTGENSRMMEIATTGKDAAVLAGANEDPVASYYYAVNLGLILRVKGLFALNKIPLIEKALLNAVKKPKTDLGGPLRVLGMLYLKAPAWPKGIGDIDKALEYLSRAAEEYPGHPLNHIFYAEVLIEDGRTGEAKKELETAQNLNRTDIWGSFYSNRWQEDINRLQQQ